MLFFFALFTLSDAFFFISRPPILYVLNYAAFSLFASLASDFLYCDLKGLFEWDLDLSVCTLGTVFCTAFFPEKCTKSTYFLRPVSNGKVFAFGSGANGRLGVGHTTDL